jgi:anti-anti-sigma factor
MTSPSFMSSDGANEGFMLKTNAGSALFAVHEGTYVLKLAGEVRVPMCGTLDQFIERMFTDAALTAVAIDLSETQVIDSTALGLLAKIAIYFDKRFGGKPLLLSPNEDITRILLSMGFPQIFDLRTEALSMPQATEEVVKVSCNELNACDKVLEAHQILMGLNEKNRETFRDVVSALEAARAQSSPEECDCAAAGKVVAGPLGTRLTSTS